MNAADNSEKILNLFEVSCIELFESFDTTVSITRAKPVLAEDSVVAFIDAENEDIDTGFLLRIPESVLALTYPDPSTNEHITDAALEDWIGEIANRLIGLFKAELMKHGCVVTIGLPVTYVGVELDELLPSDVPIHHFQLDIDNELCECQLSVQILNEELILSQESEEEGGSDEPDSGELEFF